MAFLSTYVDPCGPGVALALVDDAGRVDIDCQGLADIEQGVAISADTRFDLASASKTFTAAAILRLVDRDQLALTSPVASLVPGFEPSTVGRPITVRDLLAHTSGLHDYLELGMHAAPEDVTPGAITSSLPTWSRAAEAGTGHVYSNTNYVVLSLVIEAVTGARFADFMFEELFQPLGLGHTTTCGSGGDAEVLAKGYRNLGYGRALVVAVEDYPLDTLGDGGVSSTLNDLIRWQTLLWRGEIVATDALRLMTTPAVLDSGQAFDYGLGMQVERDAAGRTWCGHGGSWTRSTTLVGRYVEEGCSVIVLSNEIMAPVERISQRAVALHDGGLGTARDSGRAS